MPPTRIMGRPETCISRLLRAAMTMATLTEPSPPRTPTIRREPLVLRPFAGLLVSSRGGAPIMVWVTSMCRRLFLDSLLGKYRVPPRSFITPRAGYR